MGSGGGTGPATAGIAEFLGRRAGIPVMWASRGVLVCFSAGTGVPGTAFLLIMCIWSVLLIFFKVCHCITIGTVSRIIITHMRINDLKSGTLP